MSGLVLPLMSSAQYTSWQIWLSQMSCKAPHDFPSKLASFFRELAWLIMEEVATVVSCDLHRLFCYVQPLWSQWRAFLMTQLDMTTVQLLHSWKIHPARSQKSQFHSSQQTLAAMRYKTMMICTSTIKRILSQDYERATQCRETKYESHDATEILPPPSAE